MTTTAAVTEQQFSTSRKLFHWTIALLLFIQIPFGWYMVDLPLSPDKLQKYSLHKAFGMIIFTVAVLRLVWAALTPRPLSEPAARLSPRGE